MAKRFLGRENNAASRKVLEKDLGSVSFDVSTEDSPNFQFILKEPSSVKQNAENKEFWKPKTPVDVSSEILKQIRTDAARHLSGSFKREELVRACITIPADFNQAQRDATCEAAKKAGFEFVELLHEPVAAVIAHLHDRAVDQGKFLVYDLGGGTFDVTVVEVKPGEKNDDGEKHAEIRKRVTLGDSHLGGEDID